MPIKRYEHDPRTPQQRRSDEALLEELEAGKLDRPSEDALVTARTKALARKEVFRTLAALLGVQIAAVRRELNVTQEQLAKAIGTSKSNISRIETGAYGGLTIQTLLRILGALRETNPTATDTLLWNAAPAHPSNADPSEYAAIASIEGWLEAL